MTDKIFDMTDELTDEKGEKDKMLDEKTRDDQGKVRPCILSFPLSLYNHNITDYIDLSLSLSTIAYSIQNGPRHYRYC